MSPVAQLNAGGFITFRIKPTDVRDLDDNDKSRIMPTH